MCLLLNPRTSFQSDDLQSGLPWSDWKASSVHKWHEEGSVCYYILHPSLKEASTLVRWCLDSLLMLIQNRWNSFAGGFVIVAIRFVSLAQLQPLPVLSSHCLSQWCHRSTQAACWGFRYTRLKPLPPPGTWSQPHLSGPNHGETFHWFQRGLNQDNLTWWRKWKIS